MTIEPMGSPITVQAQAPIRKAEVSSVSKSVETVEVNNSQVVADRSTIVVSDVQEHGKNRQSTEQDQEQQNRKVRKAVETMNKSMGSTEALFGIHEGTNRVTIKIIDRETKEVIKELPPEKTLDMIEKVWEMAGILVDERR
jgi:flagellar protein FlaG